MQRKLTKIAARLAIPNPIITAEEHWNASTVVYGHPIAALRGKGEYRLADHANVMVTGREEMRKQCLEKLKNSPVI